MARKCFRPSSNEGHVVACRILDLIPTFLPANHFEARRYVWYLWLALMLSKAEDPGQEGLRVLLRKSIHHKI